MPCVFKISFNDRYRRNTLVNEFSRQHPLKTPFFSGVFPWCSTVKKLIKQNNSYRNLQGKWDGWETPNYFLHCKIPLAFGILKSTFFCWIILPQNEIYNRHQTCGKIWEKTFRILFPHRDTFFSYTLRKGIKKNIHPTSPFNFCFISKHTPVLYEYTQNVGDLTASDPTQHSST